MSGFVVLNSGDRLEGQIIKHNRWNVASTQKLTVTNSDGSTSKVSDPNGVDIIEDVRVIFPDGERTFSTFNIKYYGIHFKTSDWTQEDKTETHFCVWS